MTNMLQKMHVQDTATSPWRIGMRGFSAVPPLVLHRAETRAYAVRGHLCARTAGYLCGPR